MQQVSAILDISISLDKMANHADRISECYPVGATCANIQLTSAPDRSDRIAISYTEGTPSVERDTSCVEQSACRCSSRRATTPSGLTTGKQSHQPVTSKAAAGQSRPSRLFYTSDKSSGLRFLVDTGAEICVVPLPRRHHIKPSQFSLQPANITTIRTTGQQPLTLDIGLRRRFQWIFVQADVKSPITGADFLIHFGLAVDLKHCKLVDTTNTLLAVGFAASEPSVSIQLTVPSSPFADILKGYSSLTKLCQFTGEIQHMVKYHIIITEQPVHAHPRHLHPEKLRIARNDFEHMMNLGIIRSSSSTCCPRNRLMIGDHAATLLHHLISDPHAQLILTNAASNS
nr:unnamed protein product [Spirometra erinaceieuropaei]